MNTKPTFITTPGYDKQSALWFFDDCAFSPTGILFRDQDGNFTDASGSVFRTGYDFRNSIHGAPKMFPEDTTHPQTFFSIINEDPKAEGECVARIFLGLAADLMETFGGLDGLLVLGNSICYAIAPELIEKYNAHPGLWITGTRGAYKTTTAAALMRIWGFDPEYRTFMLSGGTTAVAIDRVFSQYCNIPVHLDEFRTDDADKGRISSLREPFNRQSKSKGTTDGSNNIRTITPTTSPIITGEGCADEATMSRYLFVEINPSNREESAALRHDRYWRMQFRAKDHHRIGRLLLTMRPQFADYAIKMIDLLMDASKGEEGSDRTRFVNIAAYAGYMATVDFLMLHFNPLGDSETQHVFPVAEHVNARLHEAHHLLFRHVETRIKGSN